MNAQNFIALKPKGQALNISPAWLLNVKKEIGEELAAEKIQKESRLMQTKEETTIAIQWLRSCKSSSSSKEA